MSPEDKMLYSKIMAHIHENAGEHDLTVSAFIVDISQSEPRIYLHMHKKLGRLLQFGGHVELNETPWQALVHELREEAGFTIDQLRVLQPNPRLRSLDDAILHPVPVIINTHAFNNSHNHTDMGYAFATEQSPLLSPDAGESSDIRLLNRSEIASIEGNQIIPNVRQICLFIIDEILGVWEEVNTDIFQY
jgi:8-oxo-dGTP pyrophosphatase MutT (NUDIX family)